MAKTLSATVLAQIANGDVKAEIDFTINGTDTMSYLLDWTVSYNKDFGSASAKFTLNNNDARFGSDGTAEINIGDVISCSGAFADDSVDWPIFYGVVNQRTVSKSSGKKTFVITCLDYISILQNWDINYETEGDKVRVTNEVLSPNFLASPSEMLSQIFDFANSSIVSDPAPVIMIKDVDDFEDPQYDGFDILYETGQLYLSFPINALDNYEVIARDYWYYVHGVFAEDILEDLLTQADAYGNYLFGETSAADVITNHLTTTFEVEEGTGESDTLTPNYSTTTITIETQLAAEYYAAESGYDATILYLDDNAGFPDGGTGSINGDEFTYVATGSGNTLTGVSGLSDHNEDDYCENETTYSIGQVWYLKYTNLVTTLATTDFTLDSGSTVEYVDKRMGRIILDSGISTSSSVVCSTDYSFKTLQATGVELNQFLCREREIENVYKAIEKLRKYLAPNYIIRTQGDAKIWATYLSQKITSDYDLSLVTSVNYLEDEDLYTRTKFFGKNSNPLNLMFGVNVGFQTTGEDYMGYAEQVALSFLGAEDNMYVFGTALGNVGHILVESGGMVPVVWINNVPINDEAHEYNYYEVESASVRVHHQIDAIKDLNWIGTPYISGYKEHDIFFYTIQLKHRNIWPDAPVIFYNSSGVEVARVAANDQVFNYMTGTYKLSDLLVARSELADISTASYTVFYSSDDLEIDYENLQFKISKNLFDNVNDSLVTASFEYVTSLTAVASLGNVIDGRYDTQLQTEFYAEPPSDYNYAIIDLGETKTVQVLDITAGFYRPTAKAKFDVGMTLSLEYSTDGATYYSLGNGADNFTLSGGQSKSFDEQSMGDDLELQYIKLKIEDLSKVDYGDGFYPIALSEIAAYSDIIVKGESRLIPTTKTTESVTHPQTTINVVDTHGFTDPELGETVTAYFVVYTNYNIETITFTYTGIDSGNTFTGCTVPDGTAVASGTPISKQLETTTRLYDTNYILPNLKDRLYKKMEISDELLYTQTRIDALSAAYLEEYYKNHSTITAQIMYAPYLQVGQTIAVTDTYNNIDDNYFITAISNSSGKYSVTMARYREDS